MQPTSRALQGSERRSRSVRDARAEFKLSTYDDRTWNLIFGHEMRIWSPERWADFLNGCDDPDVYEAIASLLNEHGVIRGTVPELRRRMESLLERLKPQLAGRSRWLYWTGLTRRSRAADAALAELFGSIPPGTKYMFVTYSGGDLRKTMRRALDSAYRVLDPGDRRPD